MKKKKKKKTLDWLRERESEKSEWKTEDEGGDLRRDELAAIGGWVVYRGRKKREKKP